MENTENTAKDNTVKDPSKDKKNVFVLKIRRRIDGTEIFMKSEKIEALMKEWAKDKQDDPMTAGDFCDVVDLNSLKAYTVNTQSLPLLPSGKKAWGLFYNGILLNNQTFNLRYITFVGLGQGVTLKILQPYSTAIIQKILESAKQVVGEFLSEFAKPLEGNLVINEKDIAK